MKAEEAELRLEEAGVYDPTIKMPTSKAYINDSIYGDNQVPNRLIIKNINTYWGNNIDGDKLPVETIDTNKITPTKRFISLDRLSAVKHRQHEINTNAYLMNYGGMYYIIDGHHRIANKIMNGEKIIKAHVYTI